MSRLNPMPKIWYFIIAAIIVVIDALTKYSAASHLSLGQVIAVFPGLNITLAHNTGAAFSFLASASGWQNLFFIVIAFLMSLLLIAWIWQSPPEKLKLISFSLILAGAVGNAIDRLFLGYVIDFIDVYIHTWHWPAFNVADSAICIGVVLFVYYECFKKAR